MLFDLRGAGRRTTVKVVYLTLALLMGGGLVFFGIGGDVSGGLVDALTNRGASAVGTGEFRNRVQQAERRARANPDDAAAWAAVARARFQLASVGENFDQQTGQYSEEGKAHLRAAGQAWERHLALDPEQPDDSVANLMVQSYSQSVLNEPEKAVRAQEIITEERPKAQTFATLAVLAYQAGQTRKGDLARKEALAMADKDEREGLKAQIDGAKQAALTQAIQENAPPDTGGGGAGGGGGDGGGGGRGDRGGRGGGGNSDG